MTWAYLTRPETPTADDRPIAPTSDGVQAAAPPPPTCREVLEKTGKDPIGTCRSVSGQLLTIGLQSRPLLVGSLTARVLDTDLQRATTPEGRARGRARVSVRVSLLNRGEAPVGVGWSLIDLSVGGMRVAPDRAAARLPGSWRIGALPAGQRRTGELRFETAGAVTQRLLSSRRADLAIRLEENRLGVIRLQVPSV